MQLMMIFFFFFFFNFTELFICKGVCQKVFSAYPLADKKFSKIRFLMINICKNSEEEGVTSVTEPVSIIKE